MFEISLPEIRKGDFIIAKDTKRKHRVRNPKFDKDLDSIEIGLGEVIHRDLVESVWRNYQPGDWRAN